MRLVRTGKPTKSNTIPECCILYRCRSVRLRVTSGLLSRFFRSTDQVQTPTKSRPLQSLAPHHMQLLESCLEHRAVVLCLEHSMDCRWNRHETCNEHRMRWQWVRRKTCASGIHWVLFYWSLVSLPRELPMAVSSELKLQGDGQRSWCPFTI